MYNAQFPQSYPSYAPPMMHPQSYMSQAQQQPQAQPQYAQPFYGQMAQQAPPPPPPAPVPAAQPNMQYCGAPTMQAQLTGPLGQQQEYMIPPIQPYLIVNGRPQPMVGPPPQLLWSELSRY